MKSVYFFSNAVFFSAHWEKVNEWVVNFSREHASGGAIWVGLSLDPEGRKRLLVQVNSFALKKRLKYEIAVNYI